MNDEDYMRVAIREAKKTSNSNYKTPYAAVIVKNNKIICVEHNTTKQKNNPINHAEINVIKSACKKLNSMYLEDCTLYSTFEPCPMCFTAVWWAKISKIVFGGYISDIEKIGNRQIKLQCKDINNKVNPKIKIKEGFLREECLELLK